MAPRPEMGEPSTGLSWDSSSQALLASGSAHANSVNYQEARLTQKACVSGSTPHMKSLRFRECSSHEARTFPKARLTRNACVSASSTHTKIPRFQEGVVLPTLRACADERAIRRVYPDPALSPPLHPQASPPKPDPSPGGACGGRFLE